MKEKSDDSAGHFVVTERDRSLFEQLIGDFLPSEVFDAHAHLYDLKFFREVAPGNYHLEGPSRCGWHEYRQEVAKWMGERTPEGGLFFSSLPSVKADLEAANRFVIDEVTGCDKLRGLLFIRPTDDPQKVLKFVQAPGIVGFKVYLLFADRADPYQSEVEEFLPEWVWEIADERGLVILLHLAKDEAIADPANQDYVRRHCLRYPQAKLILAHCARCFNVNHALDGLRSLRGLDNVFFDNSAICDPYPIEEIIRLFGPTRLMFGTDFPICQLRGKAVSLSDGFLWLSHKNVDWGPSTPFGRHTNCGIESILALKQACRKLHLSNRDLELIFFKTAHLLFGIGERAVSSGQKLYREAKRIIPGGTQLFGKRSELFAPLQWPAYFREARGCTLIDLDENHYVDMSTMGILACVFGYADPDVVAAVQRRVQFGSMTTLNPPEEVEVARLLLEFHPWAECVRFARTGGESMAVAVRIARSVTAREAVAICGYHGWHDWYLAANVGTGGKNVLKDHLLPGLLSHGVPPSLAGTTFPFHFNRLDELEEIFSRKKGELAAVVLEPSRGQLPEPGFLEGVRELCNRYGSILIVDEISIGWRLTRGGAHLRFNLEPDIAVFAKTISNGHPMGAIIGTRKAMEGALQSFISSAYWSEAVGPAAALVTLKKMKEVDVVGHLTRIGKLVKATWRDLARKHGLEIDVVGHDPLPGFRFTHPEALALETLLTVRMLKAGYLATTNAVVTVAHEAHHIEAYSRALDPVFAELKEATEKEDVEERIGGPVKSSGFARLT